MAGQVRKLLRDATTEVHYRLHRHPLLAPVMAPALTLAQYITALRALYGLHAVSDSRLAERWPRRTHRAPPLATDLETLGVDPATCPIFTDMASYTTPAAFLGGRYVVDGSYFGSSPLAANVKRTLGFDATTGGASFLDTPDLEPTRDWRSLMAWLEELESPEEREQARQAAELTFAEVARWLDRCADQAQA